MPRFKVQQGPLQHDGKRYEEGHTVEMDGDAAEPLKERGVLAPARAERAQSGAQTGAQSGGQAGDQGDK